MRSAKSEEYEGSRNEDVAFNHRDDKLNRHHAESEQTHYGCKHQREGAAEVCEDARRTGTVNESARKVEPSGKDIAWI
jgi:hypothetical protein